MRPFSKRKKRQEITTTNCTGCGKLLTESEAFLSEKCFNCEHEKKKQIDKFRSRLKDIDDLIN